MRFCILFLLFTMPVFGFAQDPHLPLWIKNVVYIDPDYRSDVQNGTISQPFNSVKFTWNSHTAYLFKRNTSLNIPKGQMIKADSIFIGAYGTGDRPKLQIRDKNRNFMVIGNENTIQSLAFFGLDTAASSLFEIKGNHGDCWADDLVISRGFRGMIAGNCNHLKISRCTVFRVSHDGMYFWGNKNLVVTHCRVYDINTGWAKDIGGDCIQGETNSFVFIDSCMLDHSAFPGKFALIQNGYDSCIVRHSTLISHDSSSAVFIGGNSKGWLMEDCKVIGGKNGVWNNTKLVVDNCVFDNQNEYAIFEGGDKWIYNCTFANQNTGIRSWSGDVKEIRNCIFYRFQHAYAAKNVNADHNCYFNPDGHYEDKKAHWGTNVIDQDPRFVNAAKRDFRLSEGSPCLHSGTNDIPVKRDLSDLPANKRENLNMGAYGSE